MRVFLCGNGASGAAIARYLAAHPESELVGAAVHPPARARDADEIGALCGAPVLVGAEINTPAGLAALRDRRPDVLLSVHFGFILAPAVLEAVPHPINLHPSYLPYGRGADPNVWAIVEGAPAGVTLHVMSAQVDQGPILAQRRVAYDWSDTGETLYARLLCAETELFADAWPRFLAGELEPRPQPTPPDRSRTHTRRELRDLDRLDPDVVMPVRDVLNRLRARSFPPFDGCYVEEGDGGRTYFRLEPYRRSGSRRTRDEPGSQG